MVEESSAALWRTIWLSLAGRMLFCWNRDSEYLCGAPGGPHWLVVGDAHYRILKNTPENTLSILCILAGP